MTTITRTSTPPLGRAAARALTLTLLALPFLLGWLAGALVTASSWAAAAVIVGWRTARTQGRGEA